MKSIVLYYSESGNTKKLAKTIAQKISCEAKSVSDFKIENITEYDLLFLGTPVHGLAPAKIVQEFLIKLPQMPGKKAAVFCTMHMLGDKKVFKIMKKKLEEKKIFFIDGFSCLGRSRLMANFGPRIFEKNKPDEKDLKRAEEFAKKVEKSAMAGVNTL